MIPIIFHGSHAGVAPPRPDWMLTASPPASRISGLPNLFGVCVVMCHHSLPGLVTPISNKKKLYSLTLGDYALILAFYFILAFTGIFAFRDINDLYTLNFQVCS